MGVTKLVPRDTDGNIIKVNNNSSCTIRWKLYSEDKVTPVPNSAINTALMTLYHEVSGDVINSREDVDVSGFFDANGQFSMHLSADDNPFVSTLASLDEEVHIAQFTINCVTGGVDRDLMVDFWVYVERTYEA